MVYKTGNLFGETTARSEPTTTGEKPMEPKASDLLGVGIYTPTEAAMYARMPANVLTRWLFGAKAGDAAVRRQLADYSSRIVTFYDLIQALAIRRIREQHGVSLNAIRKAVTEAEQKFGIKYPLARRGVTYLWRGTLHIRVQGVGVMEARGLHHEQQVAAEMLRYDLLDVAYGEEGIAETYSPFGKGNLRIVINPRMRFGEPMTPTGYTARTLSDAVEIEGGDRQAAKAYGVSLAEIRLARDYFAMLREPMKVAA